LHEKPEPGHFAFLEICDNGCGMTTETISRLFDPFFTTKFTGRGLGMSAVMGIIRKHNGAIMVKSQPGEGTTFTVLFPTTEISPSAIPATSPPETTVIPSAAVLSGLALVVDDEKSVLRTSSKMVRLCGLTVITATDGIEAVSVFGEHVNQIDIVLMDLTMPRMDGITAMNQIYDIRPDTRIIIASGFNKEELGKRITGQPPAGFIRKPYSMIELEKEIRRVMQAA
jgi:CheY-like chemotaxis protein